MSLAVAGITYALREVRLDLSNYRWLRSEAGAITGAMTIRGIAVSVPDPGSPFTELYSYMRFSLSRSTSSVYYSWLSMQPNHRQSIHPNRAGAAGQRHAGVAVRHAVVLSPRRDHARSARRPVSVGLGLQRRLARAHFWRVASVRLGLRLMTYLFTLFCLTLPMTVQQGLLVPLVVSRMQNYLPYALNSALPPALFWRWPTPCSSPLRWCSMRS